MIHRSIFGCAFTAALLVCSAVGCARDEARAVPLSSIGPGEAAIAARSQTIPWIRYFQASDTKLQTEDRILLLYFTADSCDPCNRMRDRTFSDKRVVKAIRDFVPVRIRGDIELQPVRRFGVKGFPTIVFFSFSEGEIDRKAGFRAADSMLRWIKDVKENKTTIAAFNERLKKDPADLEALIGQARNYLDADRVSEALELADKAKELVPNDPDALALIGECHLRNGEIEQAETAIDAALKADEHNERARSLKIAMLLSRADAGLKKGEAEEAMSLLSEILDMDPDNFDALIGAGYAQFALGKPTEAREFLKRASEVRPDSPLPYEGLGAHYQEAGDERMAEQEFLKAIETEPKYVQPYFRLMELYEKQGKRSEMIEMYSRVLPLEPAGAHNEVAWLMATSEHEQIRDPEAAIEHATMAIELKPDPWYIDTLAEAYYAAGRHDTAVLVIKEAIAQNPDDMKYYEGQRKKFKEAAAQAAPEGKNPP